MSTGCSERLSLNPENGIAKGIERCDACSWDEDLSFLAVGCLERKVVKPEENYMKVEGVSRWGLIHDEMSFLFEDYE